MILMEPLQIGVIILGAAAVIAFYHACARATAIALAGAWMRGLI